MSTMIHKLSVLVTYLSFSPIKFYLDDLEDELTTTALRMLVKDLLILFQAGNEGVINVLGKKLFLGIAFLHWISFQKITSRCLMWMPVRH